MHIIFNQVELIALPSSYRGDRDTMTALFMIRENRLFHCGLRGKLALLPSVRGITHDSSSLLLFTSLKYCSRSDRNIPAEGKKKDIVCVCCQILEWWHRWDRTRSSPYNYKRSSQSRIQPTRYPTIWHTSRNIHESKPNFLFAVFLS